MNRLRVRRRLHLICGLNANKSFCYSRKADIAVFGSHVGRGIHAALDADVNNRAGIRCRQTAGRFKKGSEVALDVAHAATSHREALDEAA